MTPDVCVNCGQAHDPRIICITHRGRIWQHGPINPPGDYCFWRVFGGRSGGQVPTLDINHVCRFGHAGCPTERQRREIEAAGKAAHANSQPDASRADVDLLFRQLLTAIGAKPGQYTLKGEVETRPGYAATTCILYTSVRLGID